VIWSIRLRFFDAVTARLSGNVVVVVVALDPQAPTATAQTRAPTPGQVFFGDRIDGTLPDFSRRGVKSRLAITDSCAPRCSEICSRRLQ
jgi:hypothetical protein